MSLIKLLILVLLPLTTLAKVGTIDLYTNNDDSSKTPPQLRIVGGQEAGRRQFPHQVALVIGTTDFCSGSIIRHDVILTAAHCLDGVNEVIVIAGVHNLQGSEDTRQFSVSRRFVLHALWDSFNIKNNIALIILSDVFTLNDYVKHVPLYQGSSQLVNTVATTSGWGWVSDETQYISNVLQYISSKIISNSLCKEYYDIDKITSSVICLDAENGKGICNGDIGAPLTIIENNQPLIAGIASFRYKFSCQRGHPSVFTRVSSYVTWINKNLPKY